MLPEINCHWIFKFCFTLVFLQITNKSFAFYWEYADAKQVPGVVIGLDQEKAFDRIDREYLDRVLEHFNFGPVFRHWISTLYNGVQSAVLNTQYLQDHKNQKLFELTGRDPNSNSKPLEQRYNVVTIPEDLPLSEPEKSILGKGLNFVPLTKKTDEFTVKEDTEKFLRRVKLKAHFHDKEQPSDEPQRDEFESLKTEEV